MLPNDYADVAAAAAALSQERDRVAAICVAVQQIAAPTDHEEERAAWVRARFDALGGRASARAVAPWPRGRAHARSRACDPLQNTC